MLWNVNSGIREIVACGIRNLGKILLVESRILGFEIQNTAQGIRNPTNDWNTESIFPWQRLGSNTCNPASGGVEFRIQNCLGFPYTGRSNEYHDRENQTRIIICYLLRLQEELHSTLLCSSRWMKRGQQRKPPRKMSVDKIPPLNQMRLCFFQNVSNSTCQDSTKNHQPCNE